MMGYVGLSHLGIVSSIAAASRGFDIIAFDHQESLTKELAQGRLPILEDKLPELLARHRGRLKFTSKIQDLSSCDVITFSLDVSTDSDNGSDLSALRQLIDQTLPHAKPRATLVILSQIPPGFTRRLIQEKKKEIEDRRIKVIYQVETLIFGQAVERALYPERTIIGCAHPEEELPPALTKLLEAPGCPILRMRYESAELAKISINFFLAASLSATNTLAEICESVGADWSEIAPTLRLDRRIGPHAYLTPGLGIAGGNIERDLVTIKRLASESGSDDGVAQAFINHSDHRRQWVLKSLHQQILSHTKNPVIAIWGLAYKPNTYSVKNSPTLALLNSLPGIPIRLYDPQARLGDGYPAVTQTSSALEACRGAHALVIMTAWDEFAAISPGMVKEMLANPLILDPAALWSQKKLDAEGWNYKTLGRTHS